MPKRVSDEFSALKISRQERHRLRLRRDGKCVVCGRVAVAGKSKCEEHLAAHNAQVRAAARGPSTGDDLTGPDADDELEPV